MSFLNRIANIFKAAPPEQTIMQPYLNQYHFGGFAQDERAIDLVKHFIHWVYICTTRNAAAVAATNLRLYVKTGAGEKQYAYLKKGIDTREISTALKSKLQARYSVLRKAVEIEEVVEHPFLTLWQNVNPHMDGFEMLETLQTFLELTGDGYLYLPKTPLGIPQTLWVLPSQYMTIVPDKQKFIKGYLYGRTKYDAVALTPEEILHFKFPSPYSQFYGFSPTQGCLSAIIREEEMDNYEASLLKNNARPDFLLIAKGRISPEKAKELRTRWRQVYGRASNRGIPAIMDMDVSLEKIGFAPREMAFLRGRKVTQEEIAGAFDVPLSLLTTESVNRANAEAGKAQYAERCLLPRLRRIEQKLNQDLLPQFDPRLFVAFENPVPADKEFRLKTQEIYLKNNVLTINEVRAENGREPVDWGDEPQTSNIGMPMMLSAKPQAGTAVKSRKAFSHPPYTEQRRMITAMRGVYSEMEKEILLSLGKNRKALDPGVLLIEQEIWEKLIAAKMKMPIITQMKIGADYGLRQIGAGVAFDLETPEIQAFLSKYIPHFANVTTKTTGKRFSAMLSAGMEEGEGIPELKKRVMNFFGEERKWKAENIARTESSYAAHHGVEQGWIQSDIVEGKEWIAQSGCCDFCAEMNGKILSLGKPYFGEGSTLTLSGGRSMFFDYSDVDSPPLHNNCECSILAILK